MEDVDLPKYKKPTPLTAPFWFKCFNAESITKDLADGKASAFLFKQEEFDGIDNVMVTYAKCCSPVPGDEIVGFVTRGRGLSVHRRDCSKIAHFEPERMVEVNWGSGLDDTDKKSKGTHSVHIRVYCTDKPGLLANISQSFSDSGVNITQAHCLTTEDMRAVNTFEVLVSNLDQLKAAMKKIQAIKGVYRVERA